MLLYWCIELSKKHLNSEAVVGKVMLLIRSLHLLGLKYIHASIIVKIGICNWIKFLKNFESGYFKPVHYRFMTYFKSAKLIPRALTVRAWQHWIFKIRSCWCTRMWTASWIVYACRLISLWVLYICGWVYTSTCTLHQWIANHGVSDTPLNEWPQIL